MIINILIELFILFILTFNQMVIFIKQDYKFCVDKTNSKRCENSYVSYKSKESLIHIFQGFIGGLCLSPFKFTESQKEDILKIIGFTIPLVGYNLYNTIKRTTKNKGEPLDKTSFFINSFDVSMGAIIGYFLGLLLFIIINNNKDNNNKNNYIYIKIITMITLTFISIYPLYNIFKKKQIQS
tara:strand:- start:51 stop:596 length:546 start_codon:yes stop_codon:yes gene_type:complete